MFGHLKAEEFVNLMEGAELPSKRRAHLDACPRCTATWTAMPAMHDDVSSLDAGIPEPDWPEFRSSVRDELLSRSVQRSSAVRRWTGWPMRPAAAWALSVLIAVGITSGAFLWNMEEPAGPIAQQAPSPEPAVRFPEFEAAVWTPANLFEDLIQLDEMEEEQLRAMLELARKGLEYRQ
jgi:hypothetical protein